MANFPNAADLRTGMSDAQKDKWVRLLSLRDFVLVSLEEARKKKTIGSGLDAKVLLNNAHEDAALWREYQAWLPALFIASQVDIREAQPKADGACLGVVPADGAKCERCWNYSVHVGENAVYPSVCERCTAALKEIDRVAAS